MSPAKHLITKRISYVFSSNPANGANGLSADGSSFDVNLNYPISIPQKAVDVKIAVISASIWNVSPNISSLFANDLFRYNYLGVFYNIVIPQGLYSLQALNGFLALSFTNLGHPANLVTLSGDSATQRTILTFALPSGIDNDIYVDFTVAGSVREVLGFDSRISPAAAQVAGYSDFSDNEANFNRVNSYLITSNLVPNSIPVNNVGSDIIVQVPITASPGSQINFSPQNPLWFDGGDLIGHIKQQLSFTLRDQERRPAPTSGEYYDLVVAIEYTIPIQLL